MNICLWNRLSDGAWKCVACAAYRPASYSTPPKRRCDYDGNCRHLGIELRRVGCDTCQGNVQVKVFACALHGECTLAKPLDGLACCATCPDFSAVAEPAPMAGGQSTGSSSL